MLAKRLNKAERAVKPRFRRWGLFVLFVVAMTVDSSDQLGRTPNRQPAPDRTLAVEMKPLALGALGNRAIRLAGAWRLSAADRRFYGLSALAVQEARLLALTDSGVLVDLPKPGTDGLARLHDLPVGPGPATFKKYRDSEALLRAADGGWWVTFEYGDSLWHFDPSFRRGRLAADLRSMGWPKNEGVEALVGARDGGLLLLPETSRGALRLRPGKAVLLPLSGRSGGLADAVALADGRVVVAVRELGLGITNRLAWLERDGMGYRLRPFATLPLGPSTMWKDWRPNRCLAAARSCGRSPTMTGGAGPCC